MARAGFNFNIEYSLRTFQHIQQDFAIKQQLAFIGLYQEVNACREWVEAALNEYLELRHGSPTAYVYQRIPAGSAHEHDMLEPQAGIWLTEHLAEEAVLVWTRKNPPHLADALCFTVYSNVTQIESGLSFEADIKQVYDTALVEYPEPPYAPLEKWSQHVLDMGLALHHAIETLS